MFQILKEFYDKDVKNRYGFMLPVAQGSRIEFHVKQACI